VDSLAAVAVAEGMAVAEVAVAVSSDGDGVGGHLVGGHGGGLDNSLDHWVVGHGTNRSEAVGVGTDKELGVSLPLGDGVSQGETVAEAVVAEAVGGDGGSNGSGNMVRGGEMRENRGVVDEGGGGRDDPGTAGEDSRVSIPLHDGMTDGKTIAKTMETKTVAHTVEAKTVGSHGGGNGGSNVDDGGVVDEGGRGRDDPGAAGEDSGVSLPLAVVAVAIAEVAVAVSSDGDGVGGHLVGGHGGGLDHSLDHGMVGHSTVGGKRDGGGGNCCIREGGGVAEDDGGVGLRGGRGRREHC